MRVLVKVVLKLGLKAGKGGIGDTHRDKGQQAGWRVVEPESRRSGRTVGAGQ